MPDFPWFAAWIARHMARFPGQPWPAIESDQFAIMARSWLHHFARLRMTESRAEAGSLALLAIQHFPGSHFAALLDAIPEAPPEYLRPDPALAAHYARGDAILRDRRETEAEERDRRRAEVEANRARGIDFLKAKMERAAREGAAS